METTVPGFMWEKKNAQGTHVIELLAKFNIRNEMDILRRMDLMNEWNWIYQNKQTNDGATHLATLMIKCMRLWHIRNLESKISIHIFLL